LGQLSEGLEVADVTMTSTPIESFYPELVQESAAAETAESEPPVYSGSRILYWYHPDYVSNVDLVTDRTGEAYELFLYNAWGESLHHWTSSSSNMWSSPYRFNSKELDPETGMHYYGARYHHPKISVWMSVDPLAQQTLETYQFTGNNPIVLLDPDGRCPWCIVLAAFYLLNPTPVLAPGIDKENNNKVLKSENERYGSTLLMGTFAVSAGAANGLMGVGVFGAEELFSQLTGLPFSPKDAVDIAKSLGRSIKFINRNNVETIVVGGGKEVGEFVTRMKNKNVTGFTPTKEAKKQLEAKKIACNCRLTDDQLKNTQMYKENEAWIREKIKEGVNIIDLGPSTGSNPNQFYIMEKRIIELIIN